MPNSPRKASSSSHNVDTLVAQLVAQVREWHDNDEDIDEDGWEQLRVRFYQHVFQVPVPFPDDASRQRP